jgi:hypothetical protein
VVVLGMAARDDDAQGFQIIVDVVQDLVEAFTGIGDHLAGGEVGEAAEQVFEAGEGLQWAHAVVSVSWKTSRR